MGRKVCERRGIIGGRVMCVRDRWEVHGKGGDGGKVRQREGYYWLEGYVCKGMDGRYMGKGGDGWKGT